MKPKLVTIICSDLSGNALSRAYTLAKLLQCEYRVQIVGFSATDDLWAPVRNDASIEYRRFFHRSVPGFWLNSRRTVRRLVQGDLIVAVKPLATSFGLGLTARRLFGRPLLLDIDDWEIGFLPDSAYWEFRNQPLGWFLSARSPLYTRLLDRAILRADAITVSSSFLQRRYGGTCIGQARDEGQFDRGRFATPAPAWETSRSVLFLGTAREHKGLQDLIAAWARVTAPDAILRIIGTPLDSPIIRDLQASADPRVRFEGCVPFEQVPAILATASVFVLPQRPGRASVGQVPMKMIDAMALGCPIVATAVGDIPKWLSDGAGLVIPPGDNQALSESIQFLLDRPDVAALLGDRARQRFLRYGSFSAVRPRLFKLVADLIARRPIEPPEPAFAGELPFEPCAVLAAGAYAGSAQCT
jgi:glycosyltransferase involved in cell wall biosynthesis